MSADHSKIVYVVHCVDTEGPLYEPLSATFERLRATFGISLDPSKENLLKLRRGEGVKEDIRSLVMEFVSEQRLKYNETWDQVDELLNEILSAQWRKKYVDDFGTGYIFSWFILDHVGFVYNPRRRSLGYHVIFDHYREKLREFACKHDELQWHFHPVSFARKANVCSNNFSYTNEHLQVLSRRVIDYQWFPSAYRPGQHTERPDINLFLEQWIPFDYGNQGVAQSKIDEMNKQKDLAGGRFGDWRRATPEWEIYHPDIYDYQKPGSLKRYIARCLNLNSRLRAVDADEVEKAFMRAQTGKPTILAVTNHDEREMRPSIDLFYSWVRSIQKKYPGVKIKNAGASQAVREVMGLGTSAPLTFDVKLEGNDLSVRTNKPCWGPQPFFCFKTKTGEYIHENLDFQGGNHWSFRFDQDSIELSCIDTIGLATNDESGRVTVERIVV